MARFTFPAVPAADDLSALLIRLVLGPVIAYHGWQKLDRGVGGFADNVATIEIFGMGLPRMTGYAVVTIELVGGVCILAGFLTRIWSGFLAVQMLLIPFVVKSNAGLVAAPGAGGTGFEIDLLIAACALTLVLMGPGLLALDRRLGVERTGSVTPGRRVEQPAPGH